MHPRYIYNSLAWIKGAGGLMNREKVILVDVDGVLRDLMRKCCEIYKRDFDPGSRVTPEDILTFDIKPYFPRLENADLTFFSEYADEAFPEAEPYELEISDYMAMINEMGEVVIATNQFKGNGKYTLEWLDNYRVPYRGIFISPNKTLLKADFAIDDKISTLEAYRKAKIDAVCMERPWNRGGWDGPVVHSLHEFRMYLLDNGH